MQNLGLSRGEFHLIGYQVNSCKFNALNRIMKKRLICAQKTNVYRR